MMKISSEVIILVAVIVVTLVALCAAEARRIQSLNRILKAERLSHLPPVKKPDCSPVQADAEPVSGEYAHGRPWPDPDAMLQRYRGNWWNS